MNKSNIEAGQAGTEEQQSTTAQNQQVSQPNANTNVVGSLFSQREIKFRAWGRYGDWNEDDERNWQMIDGDSLCFEEFKPVCDLLKSEEGVEYFMQYTGLKDKNGKEIYEGDIMIDTKSLSDKKGFVTLKKGCFMLTFINNEYALGFYENRGEVIGNVFENPELLQTLR